MAGRTTDIPVLREFNESRRLIFIPESDQTGAFDCFRLADVYLRDDLRRKGFAQPGFRQLFYDLSLCTQATFVHRINQHQHVIRKGSLHFVAPGQIQSFEVTPESLPTLNGYTLFFKPEFLNIGLDNPRFSQEFPFFNVATHAFLQLSESDELFFVNLFERIHEESQLNRPFRDSIVRSLLLTALYSAKRLFSSQQSGAMPMVTDRASQLTQAYQRLLDAHVGEWNAVRDYADQLCVSPDYLKECTHKSLGKSAQQLLHEARLLEAQSLLARTDLSVAEIAYRLGFENPANFFHFFRRLTSATPAGYRTQVRRG